MNRRDLLRLLLATPIAATLDVEKLLWVPKPIITVPARVPAGLLFAPKYYNVNIPIYLEELDILYAHSRTADLVAADYLRGAKTLEQWIR